MQRKLIVSVYAKTASIVSGIEGHYQEMSTFQYLVSAMTSSLSLLLPTPPTVISDFYEHLLHWDPPSRELLTLVQCTLALYLIFYFRFDWLGLISAFVKSLMKPSTLGPTQRSLDQYILLFLIVLVPFIVIAASPLREILDEVEIIHTPLARAILLFGVAFGFHFSKNWNKRTKGLNHLRLIDAAAMGGLSILTATGTVSWIAVLWIGFALTNFNFEAIFKYSYLLLSIGMFGSAIGALQTTGLRDAFKSVGALNSIAVIVISLTCVYLVVETLQKSLNEQTYKTFRNLSIAFAAFYVVLIFIR